MGLLSHVTWSLYQSDAFQLSNHLKWQVFNKRFLAAFPRHGRIFLHFTYFGKVKLDPAFEQTLLVLFTINLHIVHISYLVVVHLLLKIISCPYHTKCLSKICIYYIYAYIKKFKNMLRMKTTFVMTTQDLRAFTNWMHKK